MISLTESAIQAVGQFIAGSDKLIGGLRIEVTDGGLFRSVAWPPPVSLENPEDNVIDYGAVKVFVDPPSLPTLAGRSIDFVDSLEGSGFKITNRNTKKAAPAARRFRLPSMVEVLEQKGTVPVRPAIQAGQLHQPLDTTG